MGGKATERVERIKRRWPEVRAALLALHVVAIVVLSFPGGTKLGNRSRWKDPITQTQFAMWGDTLRGWGVAISDDELEARLWDLAQGYLATRTRLVAPFRPYAQVAPQGWGMFKAPPKRPTVLTIDVYEGAGWRTVHRSRSPEKNYLASALDNNRFRKQVGRLARDEVLFTQFGTWLSRRAFEDFPGALGVRVRVVRIISLPPERLRAGESPPEKVERQRIFARPKNEGDR